MSSTYLTPQSGNNFDIYYRNGTAAGNVTAAGSIISGAGVVYSSSIYNIPNAPGTIATLPSPSYLNGGIIFSLVQLTPGNSIALQLPKAADIVSWFPALKINDVLTFDIIVSQDTSIMAPQQSNDTDVTGLVVTPDPADLGAGANFVLGNNNRYIIVANQFLSCSVPNPLTDTPQYATFYYATYNAFVGSHTFRLVITDTTPGSESYSLF